MTTEQLLVPRFKVIAAYPGSKHYYKVGDILTDNGKDAVTNQKGDAVPYGDWAQYPHLFKKLEWWHDRSIEDLPKYVNDTMNAGSIHKIDWYLKHDVVAFVIGCGPVRDKTYAPEEFTGFEPATEAEYNEFKVNNP